MGPVGVGRRAVKEGGYGLTTVPPALPYPTHQKPGTPTRQEDRLGKQLQTLGLAVTAYRDKASKASQGKARQGKAGSSATGGAGSAFKELKSCQLRRAGPAAHPRHKLLQPPT